MMDQEMEMRVWERVGGTQATDLRGMELRCRESAAVYHVLAGSTTGELREKLMQLQRSAQADALTLMGIRILQGEEAERLPRYHSARIPLRRGLAQSFRRSRQARQDYLAHSSDAEYGPIFGILADEEGKRMMTLLELIGRNEAK